MLEIKESLLNPFKKAEKTASNFYSKNNIKLLAISVAFSLIWGLIAGVIGGAIFLKSYLGGANLSGSLGNKYVVSDIVEESAAISAVEKTAPAVVSVIISKEYQQINNRAGIDPFGDFFGFPGLQIVPAPSSGTPQSNQGKQQIGGGTGFIISADGLIMTNKHVVSEEGAEYSVVLNDGKNYEATVVDRDPLNDIAFLKIEAKNLPTVELGDSSGLKLGQSVIAIGNSLSRFQNTVTRGVISGFDRQIMASDGQGASEKLSGVIQTDAAINLGNSGGPLINLAGQVVGINTAKSMEGQLIGFAIPINEAKNLIESIKTTGKIVRPYLGVRYRLVTKELAANNNLPVDYGAIVLSDPNSNNLAVIPGSPADQAGIVENDIILEVNDNKINEERDLRTLVSKYKPGDEISLKILHKGKEKVVKVILEEFKEATIK